MDVGNDLPHDGLVMHIGREQPHWSTFVYQPQDESLHLLDIGRVDLIRLPTVAVSAVAVHNANGDGSCDNWAGGRSRKRECTVGIHSLAGRIETHLPHRVP